MNAKLHIRPMVVEDIDGVLYVEHQSFTSPWSREAFEGECDNHLAHYLVLDYEGRVAGYAGMWLILDEAHVTNVAIRPEYRGLGFGEKLMVVLIAHAKGNGANSMTLEVRKSNLLARQLYGKLGFEDRGLRPHYYSDNQEDAIIMWKDSL